MAQIQINSLMEVYEDPECDTGQELLQVFTVMGKSHEDIHLAIADMISEFDLVVEDPEIVGMLENDNISLVKHILLNFFEDEYREENVDYKNIFKQLFENDDRQAIFLN